jgi:hypothetical protein
LKNSKTGNKHSNGVNCTWVASGESPGCVRTVFARFESVLGKVGFTCVNIGKLKNSKTGNKHSNGVNCTWVASGESPGCVRTVFTRFESVFGKVGFTCVSIGKVKNSNTAQHTQIHIWLARTGRVMLEKLKNVNQNGSLHLLLNVRSVTFCTVCIRCLRQIRISK